MEVIAVSGPSGSGKTSIVAALLEVLQINRKVYSFSISAELKKLDNTRVNADIGGGKMADDEKVTWPLAKRLIEAAPAGTEVIVIEGFPRTEIAANLSVDDIHEFFFLEISEQTQKDRLHMQQKSGKRQDKTPNAIANQLALREQAELAAQVFERIGKCQRIDANQSPAEVATTLIMAVDNHLRSAS